MFKRYTWNNAELEAKAKRYNLVSLIFMALTVISLFFFPQSMKLANMLFLVVAAVMFILAWKAQSTDRKLAPKKKANV